jgi:microcystin-dependent protein
MPVAFNFAPKGFAFCSGQVMSIQQNAALFSLLGTYYGGNGVTTFQLPDLRGRTPVGSNSGSDIGQNGGTESVTLLPTQMPAHNHTFNANNSTAGSARNPVNGVLGTTGTLKMYANSTGGAQIPINLLDAAGQTQPHSNLQPYLVLNLCIALIGVFPSRS